MPALLVTWFREWTVHPVTQPYLFRSVSVAYPFHIRSHSVDNQDRNFSYGKSRKGYGYVTVVSRSLRLQYGCAAVVDGHLRLVTEKLKFSNNFKIVSRKKRPYGSTAVYPGLSRITTAMSIRQTYGIVNLLFRETAREMPLVFYIKYISQDQILFATILISELKCLNLPMQ